MAKRKFKKVTVKTIKKEEEKTIEVYYCNYCKGLLFKVATTMTTWGTSLRVIADDGYYYEVNFDLNDGEYDATFCPICDSDDLSFINIPVTIFRRLYKRAMDEKLKILKIEIKPPGGKDMSSMNAKQVRDAIFEGLV